MSWWFAGASIGITPACWWYAHTNRAHYALSAIIALAVIGLAEPYAAHMLDTAPKTDRPAPWIPPADGSRFMYGDPEGTIDYPDEPDTNIHYHCERSHLGDINAMNVNAALASACSWLYPDNTPAPPPAHPRGAIGPPIIGGQPYG